MILVTHQVQLITDCQTIIVMDQGKIYKRGTFDQLNTNDVLNTHQNDEDDFSKFDEEKYNEISKTDNSDKSLDSDELSILNIQNISIDLGGIRSLSVTKQKSVTTPLNKDDMRISIAKQK